MQRWVQVLGSLSELFLFEFLSFSPHSLETSFLLTLASEAVGKQAALRATSAPHSGDSCRRQTQGGSHQGTEAFSPLRLIEGHLELAGSWCDPFC